MVRVVCRIKHVSGLLFSFLLDVCSNKHLCAHDFFFVDCSWGQLNVVNSYSVDISDHLAAPGVIEVTINISLLDNDRYAIRNAVTTAVQAKLGFNLPGPFEQVMYMLEKCYVGCGWAAYAYINSWNSVYQGNYYKMTGVQVHELGHNFGLAHSGGLNGATYTDHTCMVRM